MPKMGKEGHVPQQIPRASGKMCTVLIEDISPGHWIEFNSSLRWGPLTNRPFKRKPSVWHSRPSMSWLHIICPTAYSPLLPLHWHPHLFFSNNTGLFAAASKTSISPSSPFADPFPSTRKAPLPTSTFKKSIHQT